MSIQTMKYTKVCTILDSTLFNHYYQGMEI